MIASKQYVLDKAKICWKDALMNVNEIYQTNANNNKSMWNIYEAASKNIPDNDEWMKLAVWALYQSFDKLLKENNELTIDDVVLDLFDAMMSANLSDPSWADERAVWNELPSRLN